MLQKKLAKLWGDFKFPTLLLLSIFFTVTLLSFHRNYVSHDQAMYLYAGRQMLIGKLPFVDFFDINPPFIIYLNVIIVFLADLIAVSEIYFFKLFICGLYYGLFAILFKLLPHRSEMSPKKLMVLVLIVTLVTANLIFNLIWGQRDEMFALAFIPYVVIKILRIETKSYNFLHAKLNLATTALLSVFLGYTILFKPHFFFIFLLIECLYHILARTQRPTLEFIVSCSTVAVGLLALLLMPEPGFSNFWKVHIPQVYSYYGSFSPYAGDSWWGVIYMLVLIVPIVPLILATRKQAQTINIFFAVTLFGFAATVMQQNRHFVYHYAPLYIVGSFYVFVLIALTDMTKLNRHIRHLVGFCLIVSTGVVMKNCKFYLFNSSFRTPWAFANRTETMLHHYLKADDVVLGLSAVPGVTYPPINNLKLVNASRYLFQYPLSFYGTLRFNDHTKKIDRPLDAPALANETIYFQTLKDDILNNRPKVIYYYEYPRNRQAMPYDFSLAGYFDLVGFSDFLSQHYRKTVHGIYTVYLLK